ncbi:serine hydrolase domain-containing protein [Dyadobacter subterraneus]|uniref:Beta-lactamase family protein n=1 Tax=Dyadobacter subterraneus TaxID=2773304 RepID=A0ABR9WEV0_9BACT|nr:serine hydrolase domain-containing protein [Dyadobacter subterraneus]MBE9463952.1 beta-lactamase family protein [Dyadobacter subterraneus]
MKTKLIIFLAALFGLITIAKAQPDTLSQGLIADIPKWMAEYHIPCVGVGLIENGRIKWIKNFGDLQNGQPAPNNTLFNIASQTKPVIAMLTVKLVQEGKWNLDEPLSHYWIDPDVAGNAFTDKLTTRLVLSHQTGFPNWRSDNGENKLQFIFEPGTRFGYSGEGFEYLRKALEAKFHQPLNVLLDSFLLKPLGLNDTQYWNENLDNTRFARWHNGQGNLYSTSIQTPVSAADDLITTVEEYCKLGIYAMGNASLYTKKEVRVKENYYRGLGWGLVENLPDYQYAFEHGGSDIGVRTMAIFLPKSRSGIVVMTNGDNGIFIIDRIIKRALSQGNQLLATMNKTENTHKRIVVSENIIQSYSGIYEQNNGKIMKVEKEANGVKVSGDGLPTAVLFPESTTRFFLEGYDVQLEFPDATSLIVFENGKQVLKMNRKK